jgi:hypothetical protein
VGAVLHVAIMGSYIDDMIRTDSESGPLRHEVCSEGKETHIPRKKGFEMVMNAL